MPKGAIESLGLRPAHPLDHLQASGPQLGHALTGDQGIGVDHGQHHPGDARRDHRPAAGRRAALVTAGFERHYQCAAPGPLPGLGQGPQLGMGLAGPGVVALSHQLAIGGKHQGAHHRIGAGVAGAEGRQLQGPPHPGSPDRNRCVADRWAQGKTQGENSGQGLTQTGASPRPGQQSSGGVAQAGAVGRLRHSITTKGGTGSSVNTPGNRNRRGRF